MPALLELNDVTVTFRRRRGAPELRAVDHVSLAVARGEILGLVGESGSGKSTLARLVVGINDAAEGALRFDGAPLTASTRTSAVRRRIQMVFQDPFSSLNPRMTVRQHLAELLRVHHIVSGDQIGARCEELMSSVHLPQALLDARPRNMSGGQRQRVAIARALALEPDLLVADEPVSALDVSVQAGIISLFSELRRNLGLSILFIAHDLAVVRHLCDRVAVMYMGRIVESGATDEVFEDPRHPYTRGLLAAIPRLRSAPLTTDTAVRGEAPPISRLPSGCRFRTRCPLAADVCERDEPALAGIEQRADGSAHLAACHFAADPGVDRVSAVVPA
ncbi:MAG TPA: ABC transporter ATP-binding protein [Solirubrobacteraceae bacterium]|nr:ABC transporter ATP-binding protein [Solirubrobacteraceae bacterium]